MLPRAVYQALVAGINLAAAAGGLWLLIAPSASPGVGITRSPAPTIDSVQTATPATAGLPSGLIDLNNASAVELEGLPGIGEVLAARIVAYREEHGPFLRVDQITGVSGIGPATYQGIRGLVFMGDYPCPWCSSPSALCSACTRAGYGRRLWGPSSYLLAALAGGALLWRSWGLRYALP